MIASNKGQDEVSANMRPDNQIIIKPTNFQNKGQATFMPARNLVHHRKAGLNPLVDSAAYLFTIVTNLKLLRPSLQLSKLQKELIQEINQFQEAIKDLGYNPEFLIVCRYIMCATLDDVITNTAWGGQGQWETYNLLAYYKQEKPNHDKFFTIMERALKEPAAYIDLMELMYICLSLGYKGHYRATVHSQYQLEQITSNLYKHIQVYRGNFSKSLSPTPTKAKVTLKKNKDYAFLASNFLITTCIIMTIFVSLGYLMDVISNEAYKNVSGLKSEVFQK